MDYELRAARLQREALRNLSGYTPPRKVAPVRPVKPDLWPVASAIMNAVSNCVPDGDPIDVLPQVLRRMGIERDDVMRTLNRAARQFLGVKSYNAYLIQQWDGWNEVCEPDQKMDNPWRPVRRR
jgi:hypothetical protein